MENYSPFPVLGGPRDGGLNVPTGQWITDIKPATPKYSVGQHVRMGGPNGSTGTITQVMTCGGKSFYDVKFDDPEVLCSASITQTAIGVLEWYLTPTGLAGPR